VREPGRTAGPSATLGMTKGRAVTFVWSRQTGWTERNGSRSAALRFGSTAGRDRRDDKFVYADDFARKINKVTASQDNDPVGV
jgi:hypothetical protein